MGRTVQDTALNRASHGGPTINHLHLRSRISKPSIHRRYRNCLARTLLLCQRIVKSAQPFVLHVALVLLLICAFLKLKASPLFFFPNYLQTFLLHKLRNALMFILLTFIIGLLCFLFSNMLDMNRTSAAEGPSAGDLMKSAKRRRKKKKKNEEEDATDEISPVTERISRWLFESSDEWSGRDVDMSSSSSDIAAEYRDREPQAATATQEIEEEKEEEKEALSTARTDDMNECNLEVRQLIGKAKAKFHNKHTRSRSYSFDLNLHADNAASCSRASAAAHDRLPSMGHRRASTGDWGSSTEPRNEIWLQNTHADLHSPPLPSFAFDINTGNGSEYSSLQRVTELQSQLAPWRLLSQESYHEKAAGTLELPNVINCARITLNGRRTVDELQEQSEAFIAKHQQQWRLQRLESFQTNRS